MNSKLSQDMFRVDIRTLIVSDDKKRLKDRAKAMKTSLASFNSPKFQALRPRFNWLGIVGARFRKFAITHRLPTLVHTNSNILASSETGSIFHFPHNRSAPTENVSKSLSRTLPAPTSLKKAKSFDVEFGNNNHHGVSTPIGLTEAERERHVYMIGGTGNDKTTMLQYSIVQDIQNGKVVAVVDPHGYMATTLLKHIPKERMKDPNNRVLDRSRKLLLSIWLSM